MIDEKRLDDFKCSSRNLYEWFGIAEQVECDEVLRLARLGLWAEHHGIPAVKSTLDMRIGTQKSIERNMEAISALPKERS